MDWVKNLPEKAIIWRTQANPRNFLLIWCYEGKNHPIKLIWFSKKLYPNKTHPKVKICWPYLSLKDQHSLTTCSYCLISIHDIFSHKKGCWIALYIVVVERSSLNFLNRKFTTTQVLKWGKTSHKKSPLQFIKEKYFCKK